MSQLNRTHKSRNHTIQACSNCQKRHRRCERSSKADKCTFCRNNELDCKNTSSGKRRGRKPRYPYGITEALYSFKTIEAFVSQGQKSDDQNTTSVNSYEPSFKTIEVFINQGPTPITTSVNPYETTVEKFQSFYSNFSETAETFIGQEPTLNHQNTTQVNIYETATEEFQSLYPFETIQSFVGQEQTHDDQNTASINSYEPSFRTTEAQNNNPLIISPYQNIILSSTNHSNETFSGETPLNIYQYGAAETSQNNNFNDSASVETPLNVHPCGAAEASQNIFPFVHKGPVQNNDPLIVNPYQNVTTSFISYSNDSSSLETPDPYHNVITSPNICTHRINEQSFLLAFFPFVHEESMQNNDSLTIDLSQNTNYSTDFSSFKTTNPHNNYYYFS
ncbi:12933_t:CDS:2 [Cetraspora pellucida]|uniref:12933_t:CDS:1 n=1 Tax=Cetraspora pellucida TaxID=1433469 RepID=A0ACA9ML67_9GLOM|nr:12933_t:CDS:2 [Cetraspora pellucida]